MGGGALNRYEAFIRERCIFDFNCDNVKKHVRRVVCSFSKIENRVCEQCRL